MPFEIKPATRQGIIPLVGFWGGTGGGKTKSALLFARGLAGAKGRIVVVDTEGRRASYYSDSIPGGYQVIDFDRPYTPERYIEALDEMEKHADVGVIDSCSHAWDGPDGVLELHEQALDRMTKGSTDWKERERLNWPAWREPKTRLHHLLNRILGFKIPLICCFQGEQKTKLIKVDGRNTVITDTDTTPIFEKRFPFKMHINVELVQVNGEGGYIRYPAPYAKVSHEDIRRLMPQADEQLGIPHGHALAHWCHAEADTTQPTPAAPASTASVPAGNKVAASIVRLKRLLWDMTDSIHAGDASALEQYLWDEMILKDTEHLADLTEGKLKMVIEIVRKKIKDKETAHA